MRQKQTIPIEAHLAENDDQLDGASLANGRGKSKSELMAELMAKPSTYDEFGSAWRLAMWLLHSADGTIVGSYGDFAGNLGHASPDSAKNWVKQLVDRGVVTSVKKGRQMTVKLKPAYMAIAQAPAIIVKTVEVFPAQHREILALQKIMEGTGDLGGHISIAIEDCRLGNADGTEAA